MIRGEVAELKECSDASENRESCSSSEKRNAIDLARNVRESVEEEERPSSLKSPSAVTKEGHSSLSSFASSGSETPDGDIENSVAFSYDNRRKSSIKRTKRYLPPDEPNEVSNNGLLETINPESPGLLRNILLSAAVNEVEKDRSVNKDINADLEIPENLMLDDLCSSTSENAEEDSERENNEENGISQNTEKNTVEDEEFSPFRKIYSRSDKSAKSETCLLDGNNQRIVSYLKRPKSAPVEVASICTQTEWSWLEDMKIFEKLRLQQKPTIRPANGTGK